MTWAHSLHSAQNIKRHSSSDFVHAKFQQKLATTLQQQINGVTKNALDPWRLVQRVLKA